MTDILIKLIAFLVAAALVDYALRLSFWQRVALTTAMILIAWAVKL